jgi:hypothetical protein
MALIDDILAAIANAATSATTHRTNAQTKTGQATAATDTLPACLEGLTKLDDARKEAELAHDEAGKAQQLLSVLSFGTVIPPPTPAQLTSATTSRDTAIQAAADADMAIAAAEPTVVAAHDVCILSKLIGPITDCVTQGIATADQATTNVADPLGGAAAPLVQIVQRMIDAAAGANPTPAGSCNEGVQLLADAAKLVEQKTADAKIDKLQSCLDELAVAAPGSALLGQGQTSISNANTIITQASALINGSGAEIRQVWRKRIACATPVVGITVHVTDESEDDIGSGVKIAAVNFPLSTLIPAELPTIPIPSTNDSGRATMNVPLAPAPIPTPAGTPPAPPDLAPTDVASLMFTATHPSRPTGTHTSPVTHAGLIGEVEVHIKIDDTSL